MGFFNIIHYKMDNIKKIVCFGGGNAMPEAVLRSLQN